MSFINRAIIKKVPIAIQINLTNRCNLNCLHCCISRPGLKEAIQKADGLMEDLLIDNDLQGNEITKELDKMEISNLFEDLANEGCLFLTLSGGEVFLRDDLIDIIHRGRQLGFAFKIFSNGTLIGASEARELKRLNVYEVHITLYACKRDIHNDITQVPGSWEKSFSAVRLLREEGIQVKIKCPLMKYNIKEYKQVHELSKSLGADITFDPVITVRDNGERDPINLRITDKDLENFLSDPLFSQYRNTKICSSLGKQNQDIQCGAAHITCFISPYGNVTPCVQIPISCGNIREEGFNSIWNHSPYMYFLRELKIDDIKGCRDCEFATICPRCPGLALMEDGDILGPSSAACWMAKALVSAPLNK